MKRWKELDLRSEVLEQVNDIIYAEYKAGSELKNPYFSQLYNNQTGLSMKRVSYVSFEGGEVVLNYAVPAESQLQ